MDQPRGHRPEVGRPTPNSKADKILAGRGLWWHGPTRVVGAPRSDGYAFEAPPTGWSRGIHNAARSPFRSPF